MNTPQPRTDVVPSPGTNASSLDSSGIREVPADPQIGIPVIRVANPPPALAKIGEEESARRARFGHVRRAVYCDWRGLKWVAVGNQILNSPNWKTPIDFLCDYLKYIMTPAWGKAELAKPLSDRHPVMQCYDAMCRLQATAKKQAGHDGKFGVRPSGAMRAYILLAFDLYVLQHHNLLDPRLLNRLRNKDQYQGARHELFAAATCVRAGFELVYEDETDGSSKHTEFTATHSRSGFTLCVEAKSKHRSGVLGMKGDRVADEEVQTRLGELINNALKKPRNHPLAIFLDLNLPPASPEYLTAEWFKRYADPILRDTDRKGDEDPWDLLMFSNQPDHYASDDGPAPGGYAIGMLGKSTRLGPQPHPDLVALIDAAVNFGRIPQRFEEM